MIKGSAFSYKNLPNLGVGLGFRPQFLPDLLANTNSVDFLEITADHYFDANADKMAELQLLAKHFTLIPHCLNLSIGSAEGIDIEYLNKVKILINFLKPPWWSEHIAFTQADGVEIGHLTPLPFTNEAVEVVCKNIAFVKTQIQTPLILENITYAFTFPNPQLTETQFLTNILEQSDTGLLLDVTNLYTNSVNFGFDITDFLSKILLERVVQLHFVGGHWQNGTLIDSHAHPTPPEIWQLLELVVNKTEIKGIILERDENIPPFEELLIEINKAKEIVKNPTKT